MAQLPEKNLFMMCPAPRPDAYAPFPGGFRVRQMGEADLSVWTAMPFDVSGDAERFRTYMEGYVERVYGPDMERSFGQTAVVEQRGRVVGVCTRWRAYDLIETIQWLKVAPEFEGRGLGRALMSRVLEGAQWPVYLHTQPESFRAVGLYADLGFHLLEGERFGRRVNHLHESMPYLEERMGRENFEKLTTAPAPESFLRVMAKATTDD